MEIIIAIVVVGGLIWFGLAVIGSRKDENGMDAQDRYYHRKHQREALQYQAEEDDFRRKHGMPTNDEIPGLLVASYLEWLDGRTDEQFEYVLSTPDAFERMVDQLDAAVRMGLISRADADSTTAGRRSGLATESIRQAARPAALRA